MALVKSDAEHPQGDIYHIHTDHLGTPQEVSNEAGEVIWAAQYRAYGTVKRPLKVVGSDVNAEDQPDSSLTMNLRFMGQYFDQETGLHYNRHRYYDPECGQFTTQDPIGLMGGLNNYQYVLNPVSWIDPWGLACKERFGKYKYYRENGYSVQDATNLSRSRPDFYVGPAGSESTLPSTGYRYERLFNDDGTEYSRGREMIESMSGKPTFIGFEKFDTAKVTRSAFQIKGPEVGPDINGKGSWSDARIRGEFDTLQLYENGIPQVRVPNWAGDSTPGVLESIAHAYPAYGEGGAVQRHADRRFIKFDSVDIIPEK